MADTTWYLATCLQCEMVMPFRDQRERAQWTDAHTQANPTHIVRITEERRV